MKRAQQFNSVRSLHPGRSVFNLSYEKKLCCDMGELCPVLCDEAIPGDHWIIGNRALTRMMPLIAPIMHQINMYVHYFFVPYRLLFEDWEQFITGGVDGDDETSLPLWEPVLTPPTNLNVSAHYIWDFVGLPISSATGNPIDVDGITPISFARDAYNLIWNEYYRDETLQTELALDGNEYLIFRNWEKDYFTSALLWQQRGTAPALPISGTTSAVWLDTITASDTPSYNATTELPNPLFAAMLNNNTVDLSSATTFDIADLRNAFQIQRWMERNARAGARYVESLQAHFGVSPTDERLQRPEYIGGSKVPLIISEVLQTGPATSTEDTPQGTMSGHGITVSDAFCGSYRVKEHGLIMGIMSIMPKLAYSSQGVNRQWLRRTRFDFYWPEFAHLSEQAILKGELCATGVSAHNTAIFGYQGRYDEMRVKDSMVVGEMRDDFDIWHLGRQFSVGAPPSLNWDFIQCDGNDADMRRIFAVTSEPGFFVDFGNILKVYRPMPYIAEPGLIDHD